MTGDRQGRAFARTRLSRTNQRLAYSETPAGRIRPTRLLDRAGEVAASERPQPRADSTAGAVAAWDRLRKSCSAP